MSRDKMPAEESTPKHEFRSDIQGLRAMAVLSVVGFHFFSSKLPGGFVGVDIFFVISGYLISKIIFREIAEGKFTFSKFYSRRIRRLFPALFLVLFAIIVIGWKLLLPSQFLSLMHQIIPSTFFLANFFFYDHENYFVTNTTPWPLLHLWSLGVEEQFYIVFPILCIVLFRNPARILQAGILTAIFFSSFAMNIYMMRANPASDFYMPFTRFWEFFFGIALSYGEMTPSIRAIIRRSKEYFTTLITITGGGLIIASLFLINSNDVFPGFAAIFPCLGAALIILAQGRSHIGALVLSNRVSVFIGSISYPLYLWHWPLISIARAEAGMYSVSDRQKLPLLALSFLLATATYLFVEKPIFRLSPKLYGRTTVRACICAVCAIGLFAFDGIDQAGFPQRFPPALVALDHNYDADARATYMYKECFLEVYQPASAFSATCGNLTEATNYKYSILVWGDSHAADLMAGLIGNMLGAPLRIMQYTSSACAPILGYHDPIRPLCFDTNNAIKSRVEQLHPDIVILSALWPTDKTLYPSLVKTIKLLEAQGVKTVFVIGPAPQWKRAVALTLEHSLMTAPHKPVETMLPRTEMVYTDDDGLKTAIAGTSAIYISLQSELCTLSACRVTDGAGWQNVITYDSGHFTTYGSGVVMKPIAAIIRAAETRKNAG